MEKGDKKLLLGSIVLLLFSGILLVYKIKELSAEVLMSISGKVIDYETGKGIPNISVVLSPYKWATTDKDGNFVIRDLSEGRYEVDIASTVSSTIAEYYVPHSYPEYIEVPRGRNVTDVKIYLRKGAEASGRIFAEDGVTPIKDAIVMVDSRETNFYGELTAIESHSLIDIWKGRTSFWSDIEGRYKVKGLLEGYSFYLHVIAYGYANEVKRGLRAKYGEELTNVDFIMGRRSKIVVRGKVLSEKDKTPVKGVNIHFAKSLLPNIKEEDLDFGWALTDSKGEFQIKGLTSGYYDIAFLPRGEDYKKYKVKRIFKFYISEGKENYIEVYLEERKEGKRLFKMESFKESSLFTLASPLGVKLGLPKMYIFKYRYGRYLSTKIFNGFYLYQLFKGAQT